jgi:hypothetical protein
MTGIFPDCFASSLMAVLHNKIAEIGLPGRYRQKYLLKPILNGTVLVST